MAESKGGGPPPFFNTIVKIVLRSPLQGMMSEKVMLITFTGRKSGKAYTTPIRYIREGDTVACFTDSPWWKNLRDGKPVTVRVRGKDYTAPPELITDDEETIAQGLQALLQKNLGSAGHYDVTLGPDGQPKAEDVARAAHQRVMIRVPLRQ